MGIFKTDQILKLVNKAENKHKMENANHVLVCKILYENRMGSLIESYLIVGFEDPHKAYINTL